MHLDARRERVLRRLLGHLTEGRGAAEVRRRAGEDLLDLLGADHFASYVWHPREGAFRERVTLNMSAANLDRYDSYFRFRDPITAALQRRRGPTPVSAVMPQAALERTEFFTDFLQIDGLHHGVNLFLWDGARSLGDLRIWRGRHRPAWDADDLAVLRLIGPALTNALRNGRRSEAPPSAGEAEGVARLTRRERTVAALVAEGLGDKEIARRLGIGFATVRSHLDGACAKLGLRGRAALAATLARAELTDDA